MNNNGGKEVIDFVRKRHLSPKEKEVGWEEKHTITREVELQSVVFVTRQNMFIEITQKEEGQEGSKNTSPSKDIFNERIQSTV